MSGTVAIGKIRTLLNRGMRTYGVLLCDRDNPDKLAAVTEHGKVLWFHGEALKPGPAGEIARRLDDLGRAFSTLHAHNPTDQEASDIADLLHEASGELQILEMAIKAVNGLVLHKVEAGEVADVFLALLKDHELIERAADRMQRDQGGGIVRPHHHRAEALHDAWVAFAKETGRLNDDGTGRVAGGPDASSEPSGRPGTAVPDDGSA
jgi:hypothetical protein